MRYIIFIFSIFIASCSAFSLAEMGDEGEKCFNDGSCNDPFTCVGGTCIDQTSSSDDSSQNDGDNSSEETDEESDYDGTGATDTAVTTDNVQPDDDTDTAEEIGCNLGETCWGVVPTQQERCFNETTAEKCDEVTSQYYGQDGLYADTAGRGFENIKIGDTYYTFDNRTEILWYKTASESELKHQEAEDFCEILNTNNVAEKTNWRLPYLHEMVSIINFDISVYPIVDTFYFPYIETEKYWTLTKLGNSETGTNYYYVDFSGESQFYVEDGTVEENFAICVSSEHDYNEERSFERYVEIPVNDDVKVEDKLTGLVWQKVSDYSARLWKDALKYCQDLEFADKDDWRLPNINELHSLATYGLNYELQTTFPGLGDDFYWSSTTNANIIPNAWIMEFKYGILKPELEKGTNVNYIYTMCVRNKDQ